MALPLQNFSTLVKTQASAVTASCQNLIDMSVGSVTRALLEANASVGLWMQWLIMQVLAATRASTSNGSDLDSWVADFGMTCFSGSAAKGTVTLSRTTPGLNSAILPGASVRTGLTASDQVFNVVADPSNPAWTGNGYSLSAETLSVDVPVVASQVGSAGNVVANSIATLGTAIAGVDAVTNASAMAGGLDAETDQALRLRLSGFLDSRSRATDQAVGYAITSLRQGLTYTISDRVDASGAVRPGHFTITLDDGSGSPGADLIAAVAIAVDAVRPIGSTFSIRPPLFIPISIQLQIVGSATAVANVQAAIAAYIAGLTIGTPLTITRLYQVAYDADPSVSNVYGALINGQSHDLAPPAFGLLRASSILVSQ